ncbi:MAG: sigma 54 modulation/S30EA ribosomal C-terminal domain-containing protein [Roseomonas sp.]|nr:sigma 54 modulation/S30EA ribosomal C-terminal domain-containing protein [Roseomonas sp.]
MRREPMARDKGADAHRAFEVAAEHLAKRLRRYRRRVNEHARSFAGDREALAEEAPSGRRYVIEAPSEEEAPEHGDHGAIIVEHPAHIERLTIGEALMRLDLAQAQALMFLNKKGGGLNVVYRRADRHIGWIDPGEG